jgi:hypothetical protein
MLAKRFAKQLLPAALVLPAAALAVLVIKYSVNVPLWDQWEPDLTGMFEKFSAGRLAFADLFAQHNEARLLFPRLLFLGLGELTHWNVRYEMAATLVTVAWAALMIYRLEASGFQGARLVRWVVLFLSSLLIFSPAYYEAWLWGLEVICVLPLACITTGLVVARLQVGYWPRLAACAALATVSTYSFGNGFLAWLVLFPALFFRPTPPASRRPGWAAGLWLAGFAASEIFYFHGYRQPIQHRPLAELASGCLEQPLRTAQFFFSFLGSPLAGGTVDPQTAATVIGLVGLALFLGAGIVVVCSRADRELTDQAQPWLALGAYAVLSAALATVARSAQFGVGEALSSRYGIFAMGLAVSVIHLVPLLAVRWLERSRPLSQRIGLVSLYLPAFGLLWLHALAFPAGAWAMRSTWEYRLLGKSCLAFINVIPEQRNLTELLCPNYDSLKRTANSLARLGLLSPPPFRDYPTNLFRSPPPHGGEPLGRLESSRRLSDSELLLAGWALAPSRKREADGILLTWETEGGEPRLFGLVGERMQRVDLELLRGKEPFYYAGWTQVCSLTNLPKASLVLRAWTYDAERQEAFPLEGAEAVENK